LFTLELFSARVVRPDSTGGTVFFGPRCSRSAAADCTATIRLDDYYYLLTILVSNLVTPTEDEWQIAADIREGQINALLTKPMSYLAYRFSIFLSGRLVTPSLLCRRLR